MDIFKKVSYVIAILGSLLFLPMHAESNLQQEQTDEQLNNSSNSEDIWFGPGFYYGVWFDNEQEYWEWRGNHMDYPPNRDYYNHDHPIHYNRDDHPRGHGGAGHR